MKSYTNISKQVLTFSLNGEGAGDYILGPGDSSDLPSQNDYVQTLVSQGYLKEKENEVKPTKKDK